MTMLQIAISITFLRKQHKITKASCNKLKKKKISVLHDDSLLVGNLYMSNMCRVWGFRECLQVISNPTFRSLLVVKVPRALAIRSTFPATIFNFNGCSTCILAHIMINPFNFIIMKIIWSTRSHFLAPHSLLHPSKPFSLGQATH